MDMLLFFHGYTPVSWVAGQVADLSGFAKESTPAPDSAVAEICFADGVRATLDIGNIGWDIPAETCKWYHMGIEAYGTKGHLKISLNQSLEITAYSRGATTREPSSWDRTYLRGLADHLDAAACYAQAPKVGHVSCLDNSIKSFETVMAIYACACGEGRVGLPRRFDDRVIARLRGRAADECPERRKRQ